MRDGTITEGGTTIRNGGRRKKRGDPTRRRGDGDDGNGENGGVSSPRTNASRNEDGALGARTGCGCSTRDDGDGGGRGDRITNKDGDGSSKCRHEEYVAS